jgi:hypothetical protein
MLSLCLATYVIFNGEISLLYNYTVIRYTRGRASNTGGPGITTNPLQSASSSVLHPSCLQIAHFIFHSSCFGHYLASNG